MPYPHSFFWLSLTGRNLLVVVTIAGLSLVSGCRNEISPSDIFTDNSIKTSIPESSLLINPKKPDQNETEKVAKIPDDNRHVPVEPGISYQNLAPAYPSYPDGQETEFKLALNVPPSGPGQLHKPADAAERKQRKAEIMNKARFSGSEMSRWMPLLENQHPGPEETFYILFATSGVSFGGAEDIVEQYTSYNSSTVKAGFRIPILYLRTTRGRLHDWEFDPDFNPSIQCGNRRIADDSLNDVIRFATEKRLPVLFTLNGGIWADAACDVPDWDINDQLEKNPLNCQWNEHDRVMPDHYSKTLPGSLDSPELSRGLTLNVYAAEVRRYKKRNLQAAGRALLDFLRDNPDLFVGVSLDPDVYNNPFVSDRQWYDYNPHTIRQFREWLRSSGPYDGKTADGAPDLTNYRKKRPLSLMEVNQLSGKNWKKWNEVQPPRVFPRYPRPYWKDPWVREWELFRRHLVDLHYDELSQWLAETGIPASRIFSSQGFSGHSDKLMPFAVRLDSPVKNFDSGGMSMEGAKPDQGHLGAILYGPSAVNAIRMEGNNSLFATFRRFDEDWAVTEYNTSDFRSPADLASLANGYRSFRDLFNYGARFVSPMAWNGSNGIYAGQKGFAAYTAIRNTPLEDAIRDFMVSHANLPRHSRYWGFGMPAHRDADGWKALEGSQILWEGDTALLVPVFSKAVLSAHLESQIDPRYHNRLVLGLQHPDEIMAITVEVEDSANQSYVRLATVEGSSLVHDTLGIHLPLVWGGNIQPEKMRITIQFHAGVEKSRLHYISLHPSSIQPDRKLQ